MAGRRVMRSGALIAGLLGLCVGLSFAWWRAADARTAGLGCSVSCCAQDPDAECGAYYYSPAYRENMNEIRKLVAALPSLRPGDSVADIGSGQGFVTFESAARVGTSGNVWATDIDPNAVASVARQAEERHVSQVHAVPIANPRDTGLDQVAAGSLRAIFLINSVNFERGGNAAEDVAYLGKLRRLLAPGGTLVYHVDWVDEFLADEAQATQLFLRAGFSSPQHLPLPPRIPERSCYCAGGWTPKPVRRGYLLAFTQPAPEAAPR